MMMNLDEAVDKACDEANDVLDAFVSMAVWEVNRVTQQAERPETCFRVSFEAVTKEWQRRKALARMTVETTDG